MLGAPNALLASSRLLLLTILAVVGSQRDALAGSDSASCSTTMLAATTTSDLVSSAGASLVQGVSLSRKIAAVALHEGRAERTGRETVQFQQDSGAGSMVEPVSRATIPSTIGSTDSLAEERPLVLGSADSLVPSAETITFAGGARENTTGIESIPSVNMVPNAESVTLAGGARENITGIRERLQGSASTVSTMVLRMLEDLIQAVRGSLGFKPSQSESGRRSAGKLIFVIFLLLFLLVTYLIIMRSVDSNKTSRGLGTAMASGRSTGRLGSAFSPSVQSTSFVSRSHTAHFGDDHHNDGMVSRSSSDEDSTDRQFCPDLVVPEQCECMLMVPVYAPNGTFSICDMNGRTVLHASAQTKSGPQGALWQLTLHTITGEALAHCVEARGGSLSIGMEFHILDAKAERFGSIIQLQGQQRFELTTVSGLKLNFWGNFQTQAVNVTDVHGGLLATTEPCGADFEQTGNYYNLRVAPLANVGYSLCALLCIGQILRSGSRSSLQ